MIALSGTAQQKGSLSWRKGTRNFDTNKYCSKKNIFYPIFMNKGVGLRNENHCFLHQFGALFLREAFEILSKSLIHFVIAGLTRNLILAPSDVTS